MHRHQNLLTATATRSSGARRIETRPATRPGEASADESLRAITRDYSAELLSLAMLGRRRARSTEPTATVGRVERLRRQPQVLQRASTQSRA
jgi:hypothetical protein